MRGRTVRTAQKRGKFLAELRRHGNVTLAGKSIGAGHSTMYEWRADDQELKVSWDDAITEYSTILEAEADRRAIEGLTQAVYYKGEVVGYIQEYSDTLLMFRLKKLNPAYKDRVQVSGDPDSPIVVQALEQRLYQAFELDGSHVDGHNGVPQSAN